MTAPCANGLSVRRLACRRGEVTLFSQLDFDVRPGDLMQIAGPNGSGKTSLLRLLAGLALADEGEVSWCGEAIDRQRAVFNAAMTFLGHKDGVKARLTPLENLAVEARLGGGAPFDRVTGLAALQRLGLAHRQDLPCRRLSAGQCRRVALARLLVHGKPLWILDEPLTALDAAGRVEVEQLLLHHVTVGGMAVFTTHHGLRLAGLRTVMLGAGEA